MDNIKKWSVISIMLGMIAVLLAACGGGGGSSSSVITPPPPVATYSISGTVSGTATSGVTVTLGGAASAVTTTATAGTYSFTGLSSGNYTVTPTLATHSFSPTSTAVTVSGNNVPNTNFIASAPVTTYSVSGTVSGAATSGVKIDLGGGNSTFTGSGGTYTLSVPAGNYTITPSLSGYTFSPTTISITSLAAASTLNNFTATAIPVAHTLSGTVTPALTGVTIAVTGASSVNATTDASGFYSVSLYDGNYTVTPSLTGYTFTPNAASIAMAGAAKTQNFTATANASVKATVNGTVTGTWIEGAVITLSGGGQSGSVNTDATGSYSFANLPSGQTYTFTPSLPGYTFSPTSVTATIPASSATAVTAASIADTPIVTSYNISGLVSYTGAKTGAIRIQAYQSGCASVANCTPAAGTVIATPGTYTIRGLPNGSYFVLAQMDALGTGQANANNPNTPTPANVTINGANTTGANLALADPAAPTAVAPTFSIAPGNGGGLALYNPAVDTNGQETATSYILSWTGAATGTATFKANGLNQNVYLFSGLANGAYNFTLTACVRGTGTACTNGTTAASSVVPATIGATSGSTTVSGTVTYTGTASGPMYVAVHNNGNVAYVTRIPAPLTSPVSYSVAGVPAGNWNVAVIIDNNNDGLIDAGDFTNTNANGNQTVFTATGSGTVTANVALPSSYSSPAIGTDHQFDGTNHYYSVNAFVDDGIKSVVAATLFSGPNIAVPVDMGAGNGNAKFSLYDFINTTVPVVGDTYQFKVTYSDTSTAIVSAQVTAVLNSFATGLTVTSPATATPTFSWTAPAGSGLNAPPASYLYTLDVYPQAGGSGWYYPNHSNGMPSTQLSVVYNADGLAPPLGAAGTIYTWQLRVKDAASYNTATAVSSFTH